MIWISFLHFGVKPKVILIFFLHSTSWKWWRVTNTRCNLANKLSDLLKNTGWHNENSSFSWLNIWLYHLCSDWLDMFIKTIFERIKQLLLWLRTTALNSHVSDLTQFSNEVVCVCVYWSGLYHWISAFMKTWNFCSVIWNANISCFPWLGDLGFRLVTSLFSLNTSFSLCQWCCLFIICLSCDFSVYFLLTFR